jgi:hypothetical protein
MNLEKNFFVNAALVVGSSLFTLMLLFAAGEVVCAGNTGPCRPGRGAK